VRGSARGAGGLGSRWGYCGWGERTGPAMFEPDDRAVPLHLPLAPDVHQPRAVARLERVDVVRVADVELLAQWPVPASESE
jgi:hypothetical protein